MWTMGLPSSFVLSRCWDGLWRVWGGSWTVKPETSPDRTYVPEADTAGADMSTNRRSYPHGETSYPHCQTSGSYLAAWRNGWGQSA